ncbi:MAG: isopenicillin N synthase family oxygenase [Acidimicrobiales bacterium]|nr:isopenicillin N synthase family oxygenase [Acidimicrobiales bacterium]
MIDVPVIDLSEVDHDRDGVAAAIGSACETVGWFQVTGHGVPQAVIDRMLGAADDFFALDLHEKRRSLPPDPSVNRGYAPPGTESLAYSQGEHAPPDLFEAFNLGPDHVEPELRAHPEGGRFFPPNVWPGAPVGFRAAMVDYFAEVRALAHRLTGLFAIALDLAPDFFESRTDHSTDVLRVIRYERRPGTPAPTPDQAGMGAHADYGIVTVLYADDVPGLEIVAPDGTWTPVRPAPGAYCANIGDLLAQWTNDRWRSTLHRVVPPTDDHPLRRSAAFFHDGNFDAVVECLPSCVSAQNPARYEPVLAGEHLVAKVIGPRTFSSSQATSTAGDRITTAARSEARSG